MANKNCKCSTPYGQGWVIVTCAQSSCIKCCPQTLIEEVPTAKLTAAVPNIVKNNVTADDYIYLNSSRTGLQRKIPAPSFFPSINVVGKGSESVWLSPMLQKNQINLKGFKSGDVTKLVINSVDNNIMFNVQETGIQLQNCNNSVSKFLQSVYLGPITASKTALDVTGTLGVANGGTGFSTIPAGSILYTSALDTLASTTLAISGQLLIGHGTNGAPVAGYITSNDASVTVNNYAGNIDLSVSTLAKLQANIDMGTQNINMNEGDGDSWLSGDGTAEGILVAASGKVLIGDNLPTKPTIGGQLHLAGASTSALVIGNVNAYKNHSIEMADAPSATNATHLSILGAAATSGNTTGGALSLTAGAGSGSGAAGYISITAADAPGAGKGGDITLDAGDSDSGSPGSTFVYGYTTGGVRTLLMTLDADAGITTGAVPVTTGGAFMYNRQTSGTVTTQVAPGVGADDAADITAAMILTGIVTITATANRAKEIDTAANLISGLSLTTTNDSFDFSIINLATLSANFDVDLAAQTGVTYVGNVNIACADTADSAISSGSALFRIRRTGAAAVTCYRLA